MGFAGTLALLSLASIPRSDLAYERNVSNANANFTESSEASISPIEKEVVDTRPVINHTPLPAQVKAIYMSSCVVGTKDFRQRLVDVIESTEINSLVIDVKDFSGTIAFAPQSEEWKAAWMAGKCGAMDMSEFLATLHEKGIYTIARITVFQDPFYTANHPDLAVKKADGITNWKDNKGLSFIDVGSRDYWDHLVLLARDTYNVGFDELNFDYVRYPSDGPMNNISFPHSQVFTGDNDKQANLETFFKYLNEKLDDESLFADYKHTNTGRASSTPYTSADLFGMTTTNYDDLSIGQVQERTAPYFDFVAPMVYPSHYPNNYLGLGDPNLSPYKVVYHAMATGVARLEATTTIMQGFEHERIGTSTPAIYSKPVYDGDKFRTWIQDFDYGGNYDIAEVRAQIQASYDAGVMSFMIWAPSNIYTKGALKAPGTLEVDAAQ